MIYDYLIIGQGVAGTVLTHHLLAQGKSVHIIDNDHASSSTKVAAGIINPITGRKFVKSWMIDQLLPVAIETYQSLEEFLKIKIIHPANILRVIFNEESQRFWDRIQLDESAQKYIIEQADISSYEQILKPIFGFGELRHSYRIDMSHLVQTFQEYAKTNGLITTENFEYSSLSFDESLVNYKGLQSTRIVFCEGYKATQNPLFENLPFQPAKGQAIKFKLDNFSATKMLRHKQFIVPFGEDLFWSGGGYQWDELNENISQEFLQKWQAEMTHIITQEPRIISHTAAVRPAVKGRRPLLGNHPRYKNAYIFNGMGTKGASLVPYWSKHLIKHLENGTPISKQVDIQRFINK